ncbi:MAG: DUF1223 domain-containing protein [Pseudomonadota bacterium]
MSRRAMDGSVRALRFARAAALSAAAALLLVAAPKPAAADPVLVELYTSQGCYLCPEADAFLGELAERPEVIGLSLNVDYWDYIGWKDTLALPENKERQMAYAEAHRETAVGTPHMIVHGANAMAGGQKRAILNSVAQAAAEPAEATVALDHAEGAVSITITPASDAAAAGAASIIVAPYRQEVEQAIDRGENAGKSLTYHNSVLRIERIGGYDGAATTLRAALPSDADGVAVWVQRDVEAGPVGPILAAAKAEW